MNKLTKLFLYPLIVFSITVAVVFLSWTLTAILALAINCTMAEIALSPMIMVYVAIFIALIYLIVEACIQIDNNY